MFWDSALLGKITSEDYHSGVSRLLLLEPAVVIPHG